MNGKSQYNTTVKTKNRFSSTIKLLLTTTFILTFFSITVAQYVSKSAVIEYKTRNDSIQNLFKHNTTFSLPDRINLAISLADIFSESNSEKADAYTLLALNLAYELKDTTKIISLLKSYGTRETEECNYLKADSVYSKAYAIAFLSGKEYEKPNLNYLLANNYFHWSKYSKSKKYYSLSLDEYTQLGNKKGIALALKGLSDISSTYSNYQLAIDYMQKVRDIYIEINDSSSLVETTLGLGVILENWGKNDKALLYYNQAYDHFENEGNILQQTNLLLHIGDIFLKQKEINKALEYYNQAIDLEKNAPNIKLQSIAYSNIGDAYYEMKTYDKALDFQKKALSLKYKVGDKKRVAISLLSIGKIYFAINDNDSAEEYILKCQHISHNLKLKELEMNSLLMLSKINSEKLNYKKAYDLMIQYIDIKDKIFDSKSHSMINDLSVKYESEKIEKENEILKQKDAIKTLELEGEKDEKHFTVVLLTFIISIALIIIFFISSRLKQRKKNYTLLSKKNQEITDQKSELSLLNEELYLSREQYRSIVDNATIGMYKTTPNGEILFANNALINMLGYNNLSELAHINIEKENKNRQIFVDLIEEQKVISGREDTWYRRDRSRIYVNESAWIVVDSNGQTLHYEGIVENITKRKEIEIALKKSEKKLHIINDVLKEKNKEFEKTKNEAIEANEIKGQFLANISHEIRTPMNAIIGFSELLSTTVTNKSQLSHINAIKSSSKSLLTLINDILDLSKIQAGEIDIVYEPMSLQNLLQDVEQIFNLKIKEKNLEYKIDISRKFPPAIYLDKVRIGQVLFNIIGNAIKFTDSGKITIELSVSNETNSEIDLFLSITDTGIGISRKDQQTIFDAFKQSKILHEKSYGGTGLGLSISKHIVEAMGGNIELKSNPGKGSSFRIYIPGIKKASKYFDNNQLNNPAEYDDLVTDKLVYDTKKTRFDILTLEDGIKMELRIEFYQQWKELSKDHIINNLVTFVNRLIIFAKLKNNVKLIKFAEAFIFSLYNFDIDSIENFISIFDKIINNNTLQSN